MLLCYQLVMLLDFIVGSLEMWGPNTTTYLFLTYIINILVPVIFTLNNAVNTIKLVESDCLVKLSRLEMNVQMLMHCHWEDNTEGYEAFLKELESLKTMVERYNVPKFKFLGIEISTRTKNSIITAIGSGFSAIALYCVSILQDEATSKYQGNKGVDISGE